MNAIDSGARMNLQKIHGFIENIIGPIQDKINLVVDQLIEKSKVRAINTATIAKSLNQYLNYHGIKVLHQASKDVKKDTKKLIAFCYEPNSSEISAKIEIIICYQRNQNRMVMSVAEWEHFRYRLHEIVLHELVHRAQFAIGNCRQTTLMFRPSTDAHNDPLVLAEQQYLGDIDEIEAYARDCVEFWKYTTPDKPLTLKELKKEFCYETSNSSIQYYYDAYSGDISHPAVARFFRKVIQWNKILTPLANSLHKCPSNLRNRRRLRGGIELATI